MRPVGCGTTSELSAPKPAAGTQARADANPGAPLGGAISFHVHTVIPTTRPSRLALRRHARACRGHPRLLQQFHEGTWMAGTTLAAYGGPPRHARVGCH